MKKRTAAGAKRLSFKVTVHLNWALDDVSQEEGRSRRNIVEFFLDVLLPVIQYDRRYVLRALELDLSEITNRYEKPVVSREQYDFLAQLAYECGISFSQLLRELVWLGLEYFKKFRRPGVLLTKEEFQKLVLEDAKTRWAQVQ